MMDNLKIPASHILGNKGDQIWYVFNVVAPYFLMAMAGTYLGVADAAFSEAQKTVINRSYSHNGTGLAQVSAVQNRLGNMWLKLEASRSLIYHAALMADRGDEGALPFILASKVAAADCAVYLTNEAMTLAGGIGYQQNSFLGMLLRDARAAHVMSPTTDLLTTWIGRVLLDQPLLSE